MRRLVKSYPRTATSRFLSRALHFLPRTLAVVLATTVAAHAAINANKSFTPDVVSVGQVSTVTFFFLNANTDPATSLAFTDAFPAGIVVAPTPNVTTSCGGTLVATPGAGSVAFSGGTVPAAVGPTPGSCQITVNVVANAADVYINTIAAGDVTSSEGSNSQAAEASLNVSALAPIGGTKAFPVGAVVHGNGNPTTVTITLTNPNGVAMTNVSFIDVMPTGGSPVQPLLFVDGSVATSNSCLGTLTATNGASSATLAGGTIPANGSCTIVFGVRAANPNLAVNGNITNTLPAGTITTFEGPTNPLITSNNLLLQTGAQLVKAFAPATILSGGTSTLTVTVRNYNASPIAPLAFSDPLPLGMFVAAAPATGGTCLAAPVSATFSSAVAGATTYTTAGGSLAGVAVNAGNLFTLCTFTINVTGTSATQTILSNTIVAGNFTGVQYAASNAATLTINAPSFLAGTKSFAPTSSARTGVVIATLVITNSAATQATNVAVTDLLSTMSTVALPNAFTFAAAPATTNNCGGAFAGVGTNTVNFTGGTINAGATCTLTFPVQISVDAPTGTRTNTIPAGQITGTIGGSPAQSTVPFAANLAVAAPLTVAKAFVPATVLAGGITRVTITVGHVSGAVAFTNIAFSDTMPAGHLIAPTPNLNNTCGGTATATPGSAVVSLANGALGTGTTSCVVQVDVVTPAGAGAATNSIAIGDVTANVVVGVTTFAIANVAAASAVITRITGTVSLAKSFTPATVAMGGTSQMRVRILNNAPGAVALTGVALTDNLPAGMVVHTTPGATFSGAGCTPVNAVNAVANSSTVAITGKIIAAGSVCTIEVTVRATVAGNLINSLPASAVATAQGVSNIDPVSATLSSTGLSNLSVTKTDFVATVAAGATTTYTIVVGNTVGSAPVAGATFTDPEPANATFTLWSCVASAGGSCTASGSGSISDSVAIPAGGTLTYTVTAAVPAGASGQVVNVATIEPPASVIDGTPANNTATDTDTIVEQVSLAVAKTDNSATYTPGGTGTYVVTVTNGGPSNGTGISFADTLPDAVVIGAAGVTCTPTGTASCGSAGANTVGTQAVSFTGLAIATGAGNSVQISIPVSYPASMTVTPLVNTATATHVATGNSANGQDSSVRAAAITLAVTKTDGVATYVPGGTGTYTVVVTNNGASDALSVAVADPLPTGVTLGGTVTCVPSALSSCGTVTGTAGQTSFGATAAVVRGGGGTLTFTVPVAFGIGMTDPSITNTVTATATDPELPPPGTVSAQASDVDTRAAVDLGIAKTHAGNFFQGQVGATFSIVVTNNGPAPSFGTVTVSDVLPAGLAATSIGGTNWSCTQPAGPCSRADSLLASQSFEPITLTVDVAATAGSPLVNQATVSGGGDPTDSSSNDSVTVNPGRDLTILKTHVGNFFQGQVGATFSIGVQNVGGTTTTGLVTVTDTLPSGLNATSIGGTGWTCSQPSGPCARSDALPPTASYPPITLTVDVANNATSPLVNGVVVAGGGDLNPLNNTASDSVTVNGGPDLTITKTHTGNFFQGQVGASFTITVQNVGATPTSGTVTVTDVVPAGLNATAIAGAGWTCTAPAGPCSRADALGAGAFYPAITLTVDVAVNATSPQVNNVAVTGGGDVNPLNNTASDSVTVNGGPDLTITKTHTGNFFQGQIGASFTITVQNVGATPTSGTVSVTDVVPAGLNATAIAGTGWTCTAPGGPCTRADALPATASYPPITLTVDVSVTATSPQVNNVAVTGGGDVNPLNNTASDSVTVNGGQDLTITKTHTGNFFQGQIGATFSITVQNVGATPTLGTVSVSDVLPAGLAATAIAGTGWTCTAPGGPCTRADALPATASYPPITLTVDVSVAATSPQVNNVAVTGGGDVNPLNNSATDSVTVALGPDLRITKTHAGTFVLGQVGATYTITVTNAGNSATVGAVSVADTLPAGLTATAMNGPNWSCTQPAGPCTRSDALGAGLSYEPITLTVNVSSSAPSSIVNVVTVTGGGDIDPSNNSASDPAVVVAIQIPPPRIVPTLDPFALALLSLLLAAFGWRRTRRAR